MWSYLLVTEINKQAFFCNNTGIKQFGNVSAMKTKHRIIHTTFFVFYTTVKSVFKETKGFQKR